MLVVHEANVGGVAEQLRTIEGDGFIELERVAGTPEITVGEEELVERSIDFDGGFDVEKIGPSARKAGLVDFEGAIGNAVEVGMILLGELDAPGFHFAIETDEEVVDVEIVLEEDVVFEIANGGGAQRVQRDLHAGYVGGHELEDFAADVEVAEDEVVCVGTDEGAQPDRDELVEDL